LEGQLRGSLAASLFAVGLLTCGRAEDGPALGAVRAIDDVQEVPSSASEVGRPSRRWTREDRRRGTCPWPRQPHRAWRGRLTRPLMRIADVAASYSYALVRISQHAVTISGSASSSAPKGTPNARRSGCRA